MGVKSAFIAIAIACLSGADWGGGGGGGGGGGVVSRRSEPSLSYRKNDVMHTVIYAFCMYSY